MCLSLKLVGTWVKVSAVLVLLLGVIGIVCGAYIGSDDIVVSTVQDTKKTIMGVTITFSVFLVLLGLAGTIGAWRNSGCCLAIYNIGIGVFFVAFLIISIAAFAVFKKYTSFDVTSTEQCLQQTWLQPLDAVAIRGGNYLCSKDCACDYATASRLLLQDDSNSTAADANATVDSGAAAANTSDSTAAANTTTTDSTPAANTTTDSTPAANTTTDSTPAANTTTDSTPAANTTTDATVEPTPTVETNTTVVVDNTTTDSTTDSTTPAANTTTDSTAAANTTSDDSSSSNTSEVSSLNVTVNGSVRVQDCPNYANDFSALEREYAVSLELLERRFRCAGICTDLAFYSFSDINGGDPSDDCATVLVDMFVSYSKKIGAATIVITILLFLTLVASFCLCCHPDKRKEEGGFYKKMTSIES